MRVEMGEGIVSLVGPNGTGKTNFLEALYFALTGRSFRTGDRRDLIPFGGSFARAEAVVLDERRHRASPARVGQPRRGQAASARRQPGRAGDDRPPPSAGRRLLPRPAQPGQGPAGGAPRASRRLPRRPLARRARACGSATGRHWRNATHCSRASPPAHGAAAELDVWDATAGRGRRGADRRPRRGGGGARRALRVRGRGAGARGRRLDRVRAASAEPGSAEELREGLAERREADLRLGRSSWGPHLDELQISSGSEATVPAPLRLPGRAARPRFWP